jgi:branched-chain amino acid transport system permease protein
VIIAEGSPAQIQANPVVIDAYLGTAEEEDGAGGASGPTDGEQSIWSS